MAAEAGWSMGRLREAVASHPAAFRTVTAMSTAPLGPAVNVTDGVPPPVAIVPFAIAQP
jgi:hypothetical protein